MNSPSSPYMQALRRNIWWCLASVLLLPALVAYLGQQYFRSYEAVSALWVDSQTTAVSSDPTARSTADAYGILFNQLLSTRSFREDAVKDLSSRRGIAVPSGQPYEMMLEQVRTGAKVSAAGPNLIYVRIRDKEPASASLIGSVLLDAFQSKAIQLKRDASLRVVSLYQDQVDQISSNVNRSSVATALAPAAVAGQPTTADVDVQSRLDLLKALLDRRNTAYGQSVADLVAIPASIHVIDAPHVDDQSKTNWLDVALAVAATLFVVIAADLTLVGILSLFGRPTPLLERSNAVPAYPHQPNGVRRVAQEVAGRDD